MHAHPQFDRYARHLEGEAPALARQWLAAMLEAMRDPAAAGIAHLDRKGLSGLLMAVEPLRMHIGECLSGHLIQGIQGAEARLLGRNASASALSGFDIDQLTLVDETQAEKDIEISRVVQLVELKLEWELRELQGLTATLVTDARPGEDPMLCSPAVLARAISQTVYEQVLEPEQQALWMRLAAPVLVEQLRPFLPTLVDQLKGQGLQAPRYRAILAPNASAVLKASEPAGAPAASATSAAPGASGPTGMVAVPGISPEQLQTLLRAMPLLQRGLPAAARAAAPALPLAEGEPAFSLQPMGPAPTNTQAAAASHALLGRLFERLLDDPQLAPALRGAIARLEAPVRQLAAHDPDVLSSEQHPAWALINKIASHSAEMPAHDAERGEAFQRFVEPLVARLQDDEPAEPQAYVQALAQVQTFIDDERAQQVERTRPATDALSQMEAERRLLPLMRDQVELQLTRAQDVSPLVQTFLRGPWIEVLARVMATDGAESPEAQALVSTVDELLASLQRPETPEGRAELRRRLPRLIGRVQQGMALIDLPQQHRNRVLAELMQTHRRHLAEKTEAPAEPAAAPAVAAAPAAPSAGASARTSPPSPPLPPPQAAATAAPRATPAPAEPELASIAPDAWQGHETHVGTLPTVPMALDATDTSEDWIDGLRAGRRCKLYLQGVWATAQLAWASDNGALFMFTSNLAGGMHSMTRRALKRLRSEGLATDLADPTPVQRALGGLLQALGDPG
ncbi:MAG: DUF1631 domain-containing protein [Methylotenera sp.]|jgi:hypothetical protein|nr:DUF1631 domain-containing protein [Methylotenera sp.]